MRQIIFDSQLKNETDKKVRNIFSNLITKFAYINSNKGTKNQGYFQEYKDDDNNFMRIGPEVSTDKDFRWEKKTALISILWHTKR